MENSNEKPVVMKMVKLAMILDDMAKLAVFCDHHASTEQLTRGKNLALDALAISDKLWQSDNQEAFEDQIDQLTVKASKLYNEFADTYEALILTKHNQSTKNRAMA